MPHSRTAAFHVGVRTSVTIFFDTSISTHGISLLLPGLAPYQPEEHFQMEEYALGASEVMPTKGKCSQLYYCYLQTCFR